MPNFIRFPHGTQDSGLITVLETKSCRRIPPLLCGVPELSFSVLGSRGLLLRVESLFQGCKVPVFLRLLVKYGTVSIVDTASMGPPSLGTVTVVFATMDSFPWSTVEPMERVFFIGPGGPSTNCRLLER